MKAKNFTHLISVFVLITNCVFAQLSGTYTIGGTTPDYATIQLAVSALQSGGMTGPVIFNIRPGTYTEKVDLGNVAGASATNTITIQSENGDSTGVIITDASSAITANYTFHIFGTDYLIIRNMTIERTGTDPNSTVISLGSDPKHLQIRNCILRADPTFSTNESSSIISKLLGNLNDTSIVIANNKFIGNGYGIYFKGQSAASQIPLMQITDNEFTDQYYRGIHLLNVNQLTIHGNTFTTTSTSGGYRAIYLSRSTGAFSITQNKIIGISTGSNILHLDTCSGSAGSPAIIANNFIQSQGTGVVRAFYINQDSYLNFYYNTVNITSTGTNSAAFYINTGSTNSNLNVKNNIFVNSGGGITYSVPPNTLAGLASSDHNDLWVPPSSAALAFFDTSNVTTLADWKAATSRDSNSVSGDPQFTSPTDLHSGSAIVNDLGVVVAGVTTDIDGENRSNTTPDIGADEFTPLSDNLGILTFFSPISGECGDSATTIGVIIHNFGLNSQHGFPIRADITGTITQNLTDTYNDTLITNGEDTVYFTQTLNTYGGDSIGITAYLGLTPDQFRGNDTISGTFQFLSHPNAPTAQSPQAQCDNNVQITANPDSGDVLFWYDQPTGGNLLYTGNPFKPTISSDTTFYVESHTGSGSTGCLRITEIEPDNNPSDFVEIQNLSGTGFDATGWRVYASADNNDINNVNDSSWALGFFNAGEVQYKTDDINDHYWGTNLDWTGGFGSWVLIVDNHGNIVDFVVWDWDSLTIQSMNITVGGYNLSPGTAWSGDGYVSCGTPNNQRIGTDDHDNASDWTCQTSSLGTHNANLANVFTHCGVGFCGSTRIPVDVTLIAGITPVNLGNDTSFDAPFSMTLDAGAGYTTYLWSTGDTTQTLQVSAFDTYWVTVTGGSNGCSYTDSITITSTVGMKNIIGNDEFSFYPNPASDKLILKGHDNLLQIAKVHITDMQGREVPGLIPMKIAGGEYQLDINELTNGIYFLQLVAGDRMSVQKFVVLR